MRIISGRSATFKNSFGSSMTVAFHPQYVIVSCDEFRESGQGPEAELHFSYGVHPVTCQAFARLAKTFDGGKYRAKVTPYDPASDRTVVRESDYSEDNIVVELGPDLMQVNLNGSHDQGSRGGVRDGGSSTQFRISREETPDIFVAFRGLAQALTDDNKKRPCPKGWWLQ